MNVYMYAADLWCEECAAAIQDRLDGEGAEDTGDSGDYPQDVSHLDSASDSPDNCGGCHRPLENPLTAEGIEYVVEHVRERLAEGVAPGDWRWEEGYYKGMDRNAVLRDWAGELCLADLSPKDAKTVSLFLFWTRPEREKAA